MKPSEDLNCQMQGYSIISFDVFDTLLERPFRVASDLFQHIELCESRPGFYAARLEAERVALRNDDAPLEEVTIEQIYAKIHPAFADMMPCELTWEECLLRPHDVGLVLFRRARDANKRILILSDSYLPVDFLGRVLEKNGVTDYERLYVSSTYNKTKRAGNLYKHVLDELQLSPTSILHIGDNLHSDGAQARANGLQFFPVPITDWQHPMFNKNGRAIPLLDQTPLPIEQKRDLSIMAALSATTDSKAQSTPPSFWNRVGRNFAGPMVVAFLTWIIEEAQRTKRDTILFVARDGYLLNRLLPLWNSGLKHDYLYANRAVIEALQADPELHAEYISVLSAKGYDQGKILLVDVGTNRYSTQKFLTSLGLDVTGAYWCTGREDTSLRYTKYYGGHFPEADAFMGSGVTELFMTSPETPIEGVFIEQGNIHPTYTAHAPKAEHVRINAVTEICDGVEVYAQNYLRYFGATPVHFAPESVILWNNLWLTHPTSLERRFFGSIRHASDEHHTRYTQQFVLPNPIITSFFQVGRKAVKKLRSGFLRLLQAAQKR